MFNMDVAIINKDNKWNWKKTVRCPICQHIIEVSQLSYTICRECKSVWNFNLVKYLFVITEAGRELWIDFNHMTASK